MMNNTPSEATSASALAAAFRADPNRTFSGAEAATLAAAAGRDLWAAKAAALHHFRNGEFERALSLMESVVEREGSRENIRNVAVALRSLGRIQD